MQCDYFDDHRCRSCTWIEQPYAGPGGQLATKDAAARALLAGAGVPVPEAVWEPPHPSAEAGFRTKAKMVVGGTVEAPTLGILDRDGHGVDLRGCGLHHPALAAALPVLAELAARARLVPYDVPARRGELKHVLVTLSPDGELMVRLVLRSTEGVPRVRKQLAWLAGRLPVAVVSVNLQPEHKAVLEGPEELVLTERGSLPMRLAGGLVLHLRPQSFFQTNTAVAEALYATAVAWTDELLATTPGRVLDLYCGVGGFALHLAHHRRADPGRTVLGVEVSAEAVASAEASAAEAGLAGSTAFVADDAGGARVLAELAPDHPDGPPALVVVNPPRRGIGDLAAALDASGASAVLYSSCNATSLARDLGALPAYAPVRAQVLDMFPQTAHHEVLVLLRRRRA